MALHKMAPLIQAVYRDANNNQNVNERGGILIIDEDFETICQKSIEFGGGIHVEPHLLNLKEVKDSLANAHKVYLFTYFAPCPDCTKQISAYPMHYFNVNWYLAFFDWAPAGGKYTVAQTKDNIITFHKMGWKVRQWSTARYHAPKKMDKLEKLFGN